VSHRLVFATTNPGKLRELRVLVGEQFEVKSATEAAPGLEIIEDQPDFAGNARKKAQEFLKATGLPSLADDSGLCIDALGGEPGVYSARWEETDSRRIAKALRKLEGVIDLQRTARFVCALCLAMPDGRLIEVQGRCEGVITRAPRGTNGFGYDPVFQVAGLSRTMAELSLDEKSAHSHRGAAFRELHPRMVAAFGLGSG
jgi:XTP/dITP diphosphohydrolase